MRLSVGAGWSRGKSGPLAELAADYARRIGSYCALELPMFRSEEMLLRGVGQAKERTPALLVLLDARGRTMSSEEFAGWMGRERDGGRQAIFFAVGGADGWSEEARKTAPLLLSLGPMTLPHELARVVLLEQIYRAFTILSGHPYHSGHSG